uniref:Uncharacterized protein n=1 Tax=Ciona savignyi TaxID=51511 RepID=H2ZD69_CIOSA
MLKQFCSRVGWRSNVTKTATRLMTSQCDKECHYDIIIVGGGMVGASMACALGKSSYMQNSKVLVLEGGPQVQGDVLTNPPAAHSNRVCAISPGNMQFLSDINCWERIPRKCPVKRIRCGMLVQMP